tara:strand:- start:1642 stop:1884 length:243 start_codon:yes stop_codon:yes gene_type:complete
MIDNNLLFSLILAIVNTLAFFFIRNDEDDFDIDKRNQELLILFGVTFASSFLLKLILSGDFMKGGNVKDKVLTHSSRAPF